MFASLQGYQSADTSPPQTDFITVLQNLAIMINLAMDSQTESLKVLLWEFYKLAGRFNGFLDMKTFLFRKTKAMHPAMRTKPPSGTGE